MLSSSLGGCLSPEPQCTEMCWVLNEEELDDFLSSPGALDVLALSDSNDRLRVSTVTEVYSSTDGQTGSISWDVAKDDALQISSIGMAISLAGTQMDTEEVVAGNVTNIRVGSAWFEGRDAKPEHVDPFHLLALQAASDPLGTYPPFGFDPSIFSGMDWTITADEMSLQQIATATDDTVNVILELIGEPPSLMGVQMYNVNDGGSFRLDVATGDDVTIDVKQGIERLPTSLTFPSQPYLLQDATEWTTVVPPGFILEVEPSELQIHGLHTEGDSLITAVSSAISEAPANITDQRGHWWSLEWNDADMDQLVSAGDRITLRTDAEGTIGAGIWDIWADGWSGTAFN